MVTRTYVSVTLYVYCLFYLVNLLKRSGNFTYHQIQHAIMLHSAQNAFMYFVHISEQTAASTVSISSSFVFYNRG
jgi:hypothetical protein